MLMYTPSFRLVDTMMLLVCSNLLITVVFLTELVCLSTVSGVDPVIKKWTSGSVSARPHQVVVHVPRVPQSSSRSSHHSACQGISLAETRVRYFEPVHSNMVQSDVVQDDDTVRVERKSLQGQQAVVGLHDHVTIQLLVGEDRVGLDEFLGESVVQLLEEVGAHARVCASGDGVQNHEAFQGVSAFGLALDHVHSLLLYCFCLTVVRSSVIACTATFFAYEDVLGVVERGEVQGLDTVDHPRLQADQQRTRDVVLVVRLVKNTTLRPSPEVAYSSSTPSWLIPCSWHSCFQNSIPIWLLH